MTVLAFRTADDVAKAVPAVVDHLQNGGLIAHPTETVYGLGSRANTLDLEALADLKGRASRKPFLLLIADVEMAVDFGLIFTPAARALANRFWPGPVTLVLNGGEGRLPDTLRGPEGGIAVRWTSHGPTASLIEQLQAPMSSTSANKPGAGTAPGVGALLEMFGTAVDNGQLIVLDGGVLGNVPPSTLVDCTRPTPRLIREGAIPLSELRTGVGRFAP